MSVDHSLENFLDGLGTPVGPTSEFTVNSAGALRKMSRLQLPHPGLWVVKMVQGAVASGCFGVEFGFGKSQLTCTVYGAPIPSAHQLLKILLTGNTPGEPGLRHWIVALRSLYGETSTDWGWSTCRDGVTESVRFDNGDPVTDRLEGGSREVDILSVFVEMRRSGTGGAKLGADEYHLLCKHCPLCPLPVTADKRLVSQQHPGILARGRYAVLWSEKGEKPGSSFSLYEGPGTPGKGVPPLIAAKTLSKVEGVFSCSLLVSVSPARLWRPAFEVFWLKDGALVGPRQVADGPPELDIVVVCPGDDISTDLTEWALREPETHFPAQTVLRVLQEIGTTLHPHLAKIVKASEIDHRRPWLRKLGRLGEVLGGFLDDLLPESQLGLPAEFVEAIAKLGAREQLEVKRAP